MDRFGWTLVAAALLSLGLVSPGLGEEFHPHSPSIFLAQPDDGYAPAPADTDDPLAAANGDAPADKAACCAPQADEPVTLLVHSRLDHWYDNLQARKQNWIVPMGIGAWHWFHEDLSGSNDGYGIEGLRGTYWWFVTADPSFDLGDGRKIGGHLEYRLRDGDTFRTFFDSKFWSYEAYGYVSGEQWGTLKAGQIWKRFGLDWDGVFFGNAPYFDGFKLDPDYGLSWEQSTEIDRCFKVDRYLQFFFHEDGVNGSFEGADAESVPGYNERNTGVARIVPTWTFGDASTLALGISGLVGQIDSDLGAFGFPDETVAAYAVDLTFTRGNWKMFAEGLQSFGVINPVRYVSGGPSNRISGFLGGMHYVTGPVTWRGSYSASIDDNPHGMQNMVVLGTTTKLTKGIDLYLEYVNQRVDGHAVNDSIEFFNSLEAVIHWSY
ncbi:MAG: hypothetical protein WD847_15190 [Pirellulales bacterium]